MDERLSLVSVLPAPAPKIDEDGIAMLEKWLERLRAGSMANIAIAASLPDGSTATSYSGSPQDLIGAVVVLQYRMTLAMYGDT